MGGTCSAYGREERRRERDKWGDPGVDRGIILSRIFRKWNLIFYAHIYVIMNRVS
jgi:hypothetical protein